MNTGKYLCYECFFSPSEKRSAELVLLFSMDTGQFST